MDPIVIIVIALVVVAVIAGVALKGKGAKELPPGEPQKAPEPAEEAPERAPTPPAPAVKEAEPPTTAEAPQAPRAPAEEPAAPAAPEEPVEPTRAEAHAPPAPEPAAPSGPTAEDVAAIKQGLSTTRGGFIARLASLFSSKKEIDPELLDEIEEVLITADIGVKTTQSILEDLRGRLDRSELSRSEQVWDALRERATEILGGASGGVQLRARNPDVILVVGVNGVGKTTTIGKLASRLKSEGKNVLLVAGDTFRAAAVLQLEVWGRRVGCPVVKGKDRADPASVIFDAIKKAQDDDVDVVIADTAGRLHTKTPLMEELKKVTRTIEKALGRPADEVLLVLDSTTGQNAVQQAQMFKDALDVSGIVLTKLDGTAKGGVVLGIVAEHGSPVRYIGVGEKVEDLREFDAASFVDALFEKPDEAESAA